MTKRRNWTEDDLFRLKEVMDSELFGDYDSDRMESRIRQAITDPAPRPVPLARRRFGPIAAAAVALCVAGLATGTVLTQGRLPGSFHPTGKQAASTSSSLWTQGFAPTPVSVIDRFQHINSIGLFLGNGLGAAPPTVSSVDNADLNLTAAQQRELYALLKSVETKQAGTLSQTQTVDFPFQIMLSMTVGQAQETENGFYSPSGALVLGSQLYAPNPRLAQFFQQNLLGQLLQKYQQAGKVLPDSLQTAALSFVRDLGQPQKAYRYCVPNMVFSNGTNPVSLEKDAASKDFAHYQIVSTTYGPGRQTATVVLRHPHRFWASPVSLNLVHLGGAWLVTQASTSAIAGTAYSGMPPIHGFGSYKTLIIGPNVGMITPSQASLKYTAVTYSDLASPAYQTARIFIFERQPLSLHATQGDSARALRSDPAFQKAAAEAKVHHGVLVVAGGGDNLLSRSVVSQALGGIESTTGVDNSPSAVITVWFVDSKEALFNGIAVSQANANDAAQSSNYLDPSVIDQAINQATLLIDTWGASFYVV